MAHFLWRKISLRTLRAKVFWGHKIYANPLSSYLRLKLEKKNQLWTGKHIQLVWTLFFSSLKQTRQFKLENGKNQVQTYRGTDYGRTVTKCRLRGLPRYSKHLVLASRLFFSKQALLYLGVPSPWKSNAEIFFGQSKSFPLAPCNEWLVDLNCALVSRQ